MNNTALSCFTSRGNYVKWDDQDKWRDRDGVPLNEEYVIANLAFGLQAWFDGRPTLVPDNGNIDDLNAAIPKEQWPKAYGGNGTEPPYKKVVIVVFFLPRTGEVYRFVSPTAGARIAVEALQEQVEVMKLLRGANVRPIVTLGERHWKTKKYGRILRPHFEVVAWTYVGGEPGAAEALPPPDPPRLIGPATEPTPPSTATTPAPEPAPKPAQATTVKEPQPQPHPIPAPETKPPSAKRPVTVSAYAKANLTGVAPVTTEELLNDSLDDMPWDSEPKK
jgi:hypothetical protein